MYEGPEQGLTLIDDLLGRGDLRALRVVNDLAFHIRPISAILGKCGLRQRSLSAFSHWYRDIYLCTRKAL
jgi:hypothetical protein